MRLTVCLLFVVAVMFLPLKAWAESGDDLLKKARAALAKGKADEALQLLGQVIAADPKNADAYLLRSIIHEAMQKHKEAAADFARTIALDPNMAEAVAEAYNRRGSERFKLGDIQGSLADFDEYLEMKPAERSGHWKRGISCYYAGKFDEGRKQFVGYEQVDANDVENAVWHFLCNARLVGVEKARASILKIGKDQRVPMMEVYALFSGKAKPEDVLAAARGGTPTAEQLNARLFYAHQYLGLYYEATGDKKLALEHTSKAVEHKIGHYMWDVARVHRDLLMKREK